MPTLKEIAGFTTMDKRGWGATDVAAIKAMADAGLTRESAIDLLLNAIRLEKTDGTPISHTIFHLLSLMQISMQYHSDFNVTYKASSKWQPPGTGYIR